MLHSRFHAITVAGSLMRFSRLVTCYYYFEYGVCRVRGIPIGLLVERHPAYVDNDIRLSVRDNGDYSRRPNEADARVHLRQTSDFNISGPSLFHGYRLSVSLNYRRRTVDLFEPSSYYYHRSVPRRCNHLRTAVLRTREARLTRHVLRLIGLSVITAG